MKLCVIGQQARFWLAAELISTVKAGYGRQNTTLGRGLGTYFEGDAQTIVTQHTNDTVTAFGTQTLRKTTKV